MRSTLLRSSVRRAAGLHLRPVRRGLCAAPATEAAPVAPVVTEIREALADMKAKMAAGTGGDAVYTGDSIQAALKANAVDVSMLSSSLAELMCAGRRLTFRGGAGMSEQAIAAGYRQARRAGFA